MCPLGVECCAAETMSSARSAAAGGRRLRRHLRRHAFVLQPLVRSIAFPFSSEIADMSICRHGEESAGSGAFPIAPIAFPASAGIIEETVFRNNYRLARLSGSLKAAFARPIASVALKESVRW